MTRLRSWAGHATAGLRCVLVIALVLSAIPICSSFVATSAYADDLSTAATTSSTNVVGPAVGTIRASTTASGAAALGPRLVVAAEGIATPYGVAEQGTDAASQALKGAVKDGAPVYRQGSFGVQQTGDGQFWAGENPLTTPDYAAGYGTPGSAPPDWVMGGEVNPGDPFVTRPAPGLGGNEGGNPEVVTPPGGVSNLWFHMP
jgi:filamentous hemagglutinin